MLGSERMPKYWLPWLVELMPELFCEISPEHADLIGVRNTEFVKITTPRGSIRAKALVTRRIRPFRLKDEKGEKLATLVASRFARGDGGFGGPSEGQPEPHKVPSRAPDKSVDISTRPDQALVYRLCGDRNPLHSDPGFAKKAGFPRPILHGMCTYGITCRGVLQTYADYDPAAFKQHAVRFSSPVYPGETVTMEMLKDGKVISFEAKVKSRNVTVIKSGKTVLG